MDLEQSKMLATLLLSGADDPEITEASIAELPDEVREDFAFKVLSGRLQLHELRVSLRLAFMCITLSKSPGDLVMWAWTFFCMGARDRKLTLQDLVTAFPNGFPTESARWEVWDNQKGSQGQNLLDDLATWS